MNAIELEQRLLADHRRLEQLCLQLEAAFAANAREDTQRLWRELERSLEAHFLIEERALFPRYAHFDATETRALSSEHRLLREQLAELGAGIDLKVGRSSAVATFFAMLRAHAAREDAALYRWACEIVPGEVANVAAALRGTATPAAGRGEERPQLVEEERAEVAARPLE